MNEVTQNLQKTIYYTRFAVVTSIKKILSVIFFPIWLLLQVLTHLAPVGLVAGLCISVAPFFNEALAQDNAQDTTQNDSLALPVIIQESFPNSLQMLIARETEISAKEAKKQAFLTLFPTLSLNASQRSFDEENTNALGAISTENGQESSSRTLALKQTLLGSGAPSYQYSAAKKDHRIAIQQLRQNENNMLLNIITGYANLYTAQRVKEIADINLNRLQQHYNATAERANVGSASQTELKQAEAQLASARANAIRANGSMLTNIAEFETLTDMNIAQDLPAPVTLHEDLLPKTFEEAMQQAENFSPAVKIAILENNKAQALKNRVSLPLLPNLSVEVGQRESESPNMANTGQQTLAESYTNIQLSYNLTPGRAVSAGKQAFANKRAKDANLLLARRNLRSETIIAWQNFSTQKAVLDASEIASNASKSAFDGTQAEYDLNRRSQLELLDAQETWLGAQQAYFQALGSFTVAHYRLLANSGLLSFADFND